MPPVALVEPPALAPPADFEPPEPNAPPLAFAPPMPGAPPVDFVPAALSAPPVLVNPPVVALEPPEPVLAMFVEPPAPVAPPLLDAPPVLVAPPVPEAPAVPVLPEPTSDVTLDASKDTDIEPFEAVTVPSLARVLLEDVVYLANEVNDEPAIEIESVLAELFVFTATTTTDVSLLYAERDTPDAGLAVASTR